MLSLKQLCVKEIVKSLLSRVTVYELDIRNIFVTLPTELSRYFESVIFFNLKIDSCLFRSFNIQLIANELLQQRECEKNSDITFESFSCLKITATCIYLNNEECEEFLQSVTNPIIGRAKVLLYKMYLVGIDKTHYKS